MIVIGDPGDAELYLTDGAMGCPACGSRVARWGYGRRRTVRGLGTATVTVRPRRVRCDACAATHILVPAALAARRADTTEVIGTALVHKSRGYGFRRIAAIMGRAESTVRRWLRRGTDPAHLQWLWRQGVRRWCEAAPWAFEHPRAHTDLDYALNALGGAAYWNRWLRGLTDPPWTMIGIYTNGGLLAPP